MHYFSTQQDNSFSTLTHSQADFHTGRLFCWSGALVALTLWGTTQFMEAQKGFWKEQSIQAAVREEANSSQPPLPEAAAIFERIEAHRQQRKQARLAARHTVVNR